MLEKAKSPWGRLILLTFFFMFGFNIYMGVFQNYLRDQFNTSPLQLGQLEAFRELPGLLAALTTGALLMFAEARLAALGLAVMGMGLIANVIPRDYTAVIVITTAWSIGFHLYVSVSSAIAVQIQGNDKTGHSLGKLSAVGAFATIFALGFSFLGFGVWKILTYDGAFILGGISVLVAALICSTLHTNAPKTEVRIILRKEYRLFYLLSFLEGCRRQIFSIFASYALILVYHVPVQNMLLLQFVNAILIAFTAPRIGKWVDSIGEKKPLTWYAIGLIVVFLGYSTFQTVGALYALFLIDNVLFSFGVGFTTYLNRIARPGELTPCLAMGITMNHVAAVTVPWLGALLWQSTKNYQMPFWVGTGIAVVSLFVTQRLPSGPRPVRA